MNDLNRPPIPAPKAFISTTSVAAARPDWSHAPSVVRNWAYPLASLVKIIFLLIVLIRLFYSVMLAPTALRHPVFALSVAILCFFIYITVLFDRLQTMFKKGDPTAWNAQIVLCVLGVLVFPIGTLAYGYILSQWFSPETKEWFGRK